MSGKDIIRQILLGGINFGTANGSGGSRYNTSSSQRSANFIRISKSLAFKCYYSMLRCIYKHILNTLDDPEFQSAFEGALSICETRVNLTSEILKLEGQLVPKGFGGEDIDLGAPRLFTDLYYYYYTLNLIRIGLQLNGVKLSHSTREDVRDFYTESLMSTTRLYNRFSEIMLEKGIYIRSPIINTIGETANYAEDGINIMIENSWLEEPPRKMDQRELVKEKLTTGGLL